jgi:hypothetical protein
MASVTVNNITYDLQNASVELVSAQGTLGLVGMMEELNYSHKVNREPMRVGRSIADWTDGEAEYEASMTVQKAQWDHWVACAQEFGVGIAMMKLTIGATYFKNNIITQDTLWKCLCSASEHAFKRGPDMLVIPVEFHVSNIYYSGVDVFNNDIGTAI